MQFSYFLDSREIYIKIPALLGSGLSGNRATLVYQGHNTFDNVIFKILLLSHLFIAFGFYIFSKYNNICYDMLTFYQDP